MAWLSSPRKTEADVGTRRLPWADGGSMAAAASPPSVTRNSAVAMMGGVGSQGLKFLVIVYLARHFTVAEFGRISFAVGVNAYIFVISSFGLPLFGSRAVALAGEVSESLLAEIFCLRVGLAIVAIATSLVVLVWVPGVPRNELLLVTIFGLSNVALAGFFDWAFQGLHRQEASAALNMLCQGLWLIFTVAGVKLNCGIYSVAIGLVLSALFASAVGHGWLKATVRVSHRSAACAHLPARSWRTLRSARSLGMGSLLVTVLLWSDIIMVRLLCGDQAAGWYAVGNRAALALAMLSASYMQGAFPLLSRARVQGLEWFSEAFQHSYGDLALAFLPGSIWCICYAPAIIVFFFQQPDFLNAVAVFRIFQCGLLLAVAANLYGVGILVTHHRDCEYQRILLLTALGFVPLCAALTFYKGIVGASVAVLMSQAFSYILFVKKTQALALVEHRVLIVPALTGALLGAGSRLFGLGLFSSASLLVVAYAALCGGHFYGHFRPMPLGRRA